MLRKALALTAAAMLTACAAYAQQYEERPYVEGQTPPEAKIGEAWCIYVYPAQYETVYEEVTVRGPTMTMNPVPAVYGRVTETFVAKPEYEIGEVVAGSVPGAVAGAGIPVVIVPEHKTLEVIPARFQTKQVEVEVCPAYEEEYWVPASFKSESRQFVITPERKELRKVACVDGTTLDCYTVVGAPAKIETVNVQIVDQPGRIEKRMVPAKKQLVSVQEIVEPARVVEKVVAAQTQMVARAGCGVGAKVNVRRVPAQMGTATKMTIEKEATITQVPVPAVTQKQARQVLKAPERIVWRKQMLSQPIAAPAPIIAPAPVADVAAAQVMEDYGSIPGATAMRPTHFIFK